MEFTNHTPYAARLFTGTIGEDLKGAWVVARATCRWTAASPELVAADDAWPVFVQPVKTDVGVFPSDEFPYRRGCELVITGTVRSPTAVPRLTIEARVGDFTDRIAVVGDRVWRREPGGFVASDPTPFTEMPMDWARSFGGESSVHGLPSAYALNPVGRGFNASAEVAEGTPLPNFEDPAAPIERWDDCPLPVGWGPIENAAAWQVADFARDRAARGVRDDPSPEEMVDLGMSLNPTASPPRLVLPRLQGGDGVHIVGLERAPIRFTVPDLRLRIRATVGAQVIERTLAYSGLWVFAPHGLAVLTLRAAFSYATRVEETRVATLEVT
jgi:hypothetical protein